MTFLSHHVDSIPTEFFVMKKSNVSSTRSNLEAIHIINLTIGFIFIHVNLSFGIGQKTKQLNYKLGF